MEPGANALAQVTGYALKQQADAQIGRSRDESTNAQATTELAGERHQSVKVGRHGGRPRTAVHGAKLHGMNLARASMFPNVRA